IYKFNLFASGASGTDELPISVQVVEFISNTPVNTTPPTINGIAYIDNTLSINTGIWQNTDSFEYSWYYNSNPDTNGTILPESSNSLYLINDYSGYYIYGSVNGINSTGSAQVFTNIVGPVILYIPTGGGDNSGVNPSGYNAMTMFGVQDIR